METLIAEIVGKLHSLPEVKIREVLDFVEFLTWRKESLTLPELESDRLQKDEEFETIADRLADELQACAGDTKSVRSDYAVSRAGIYEEHP
jgi:hypothetical protein